MNNLIPAIVSYKDSAWYCVKHKPIKYIGDVLNTAKILSDSNVPEIAIMNLDPVIPKTLLDIPKHVNRPISICGSINDISCAKKLVKAGFDRIGLTYPFIKKQSLPLEIYQELGESTLAIHLKIKSLADLVNKIDILEDNYSASEYIIHDVNSAGSLVGLNSEIIDYLTKLSNKNYALSGGFRGEKISDNLRVYYSTRFMFPFSNLTKANFNEESLKNFLVIAKHE